jgi:hypothetical protein
MERWELRLRQSTSGDHVCKLVVLIRSLARHTSKCSPKAVAGTPANDRSLIRPPQGVDAVEKIEGRG